MTFTNLSATVGCLWLLSAVSGCDPETVVTNSCDIEADTDGDGREAIYCGGDDCDDTDATRYPGATEVCDAEGHDEDCNDVTYGVRDSDGDDYVDSACCNGVYCGDDCDDQQAGVHPNLPETCDERDNDCDGFIDEGVVATSYIDEDGDGYGVGEAESRCAGLQSYASIAGDCDDTLSQIHPGAFRCPESDVASADIEMCGVDASWELSSCPDLGICVPQPDGTGVCLPGQPGALAACDNGLDDDMDGYVDFEQVVGLNMPPDTGCDNALDNSERGGATSNNQCDNGVDDDMDGIADFPGDEGCKSPQDAEQ